MLVSQKTEDCRRMRMGERHLRSYSSETEWENTCDSIRIKKKYSCIPKLKDGRKYSIY